MKKLVISCLVALMLVASITAPVIADTDGSLGASVNVNQVMSLTVVDNTPGTGIYFGDVDEGTDNNPDLAQGDTKGAVTLQVGSETNVDVYLQTKGDGDFTGPGTAIPLGNASWNNANSTASLTAMDTDYETVGSLISGGGNVEVWHWISIPEDQEAGTYTTSFSYQVIAQ